MDAAVKKKPRARTSSLREKRWSMNSQRLEEIVAELMRPIGDLRHSFDTDLSALLEEYLTEAGLHALDADSDSELEDSPQPLVVPNFAELALLLQHSASLYGRKVDFLYQHVLSVSDSLNSSTLEISNRNPEAEGEQATPSGRGRKRRSSAAAIAEFATIALEPSSSARRDPDPPRPPPTLPRVYIELEPRVMTENDAPLYDYANEPIGLLADFHVAWRLQDGLLVDELEGEPSSSVSLRAISLVELQAAIEANAPPPPPPPCTPPPSSTPVPGAEPPVSPPCTPLPPDSTPPHPPPVKRERKRRNEVNLEDISPLNVKIMISKELRRELSTSHEFSVPDEWIRAEIRARSRALIATRRRIRDEEEKEGFHGWSNEEATIAKEAAFVLNTSLTKGSTLLSLGGNDSDDDGFFERSSLGDSELGRSEGSPVASLHTTQQSESNVDWAAWQEGVVRRAAEAEARGGVDVRTLGNRVIHTLPHHHTHIPFQHVLHKEAHEHNDVSRLFLATLFLANSGNVEIVQGAPLSLNSFSLRLVSTDDALLRAAADAAAEDQTLR